MSRDNAYYQFYKNAPGVTNTPKQNELSVKKKCWLDSQHILYQSCLELLTFILFCLMLEVRSSKTLNEILCKKLAFLSKLPWTCSMQGIVICIAWLVYLKLDLHKILNESKKQAVPSVFSWDCLLQCIIAFQCNAWCWKLDFLKLWMRLCAKS